MRARTISIFTIASSLLLPCTLFPQGNLTPPGAPTPAMKTLDQIEARTIINAANTPGDPTNSFIIRAAGSYYLTGSLTGVSGKHGISVQSDDVTLDLNGFALISGGGGATRGVDVPAVQKNLCVRNGTIRGWSGGGVRTELALSTRAEKLSLSDNVGAIGLALGNGSAKDCVAAGNDTGFGVGNGAEIKDCAATGNVTGFFADDRTMISSCIATVNTGDGFSCSDYVTFIDCTSSRNGGSGFTLHGGCNITRCNASRNDVSGIFAGAGCNVTDCVASLNLSRGIYVDTGSKVQNSTTRSNATGIQATSNCHISGNTCDANGTGIYVTLLNPALGAAVGTRVDGNTCTGNVVGIQLFNAGRCLVIRNSLAGNSSSPIVDSGSNTIGPIVSFQNPIVSTSPWANFTP